MKVLRAPNDITVTLSTGAGNVEFIDGVAETYTDEQADYLSELGYEVIGSGSLEGEDQSTESEATAEDDTPKEDLKTPAEDEPDEDVPAEGEEDGVAPGEGEESGVDSEVDESDEEESDGSEDDDSEPDEPVIPPTMRDNTETIAQFAEEHNISLKGAETKREMLALIGEQLA